MLNEDEMWDGPEPSEEEKNANQNWMVDHLVKYPRSIGHLFPNFPEVTQKARAIIRYNDLEAKRIAGTIDEIDYQLALEEILPLINIGNDLK